MRILIIEDEIIIARFIEQQLTLNFNCTTEIAINQQEVENILPKFLPHLILCDINLQDNIDGIEIIEKWRLQYTFDVIFITSYQSKNIIERALAFQPLNYIIKPADEADIFAAVKIAWSVIENKPNLGKQTNISEEPLFTSVEISIIEHIKNNKTSQEIASLLFLSPYTIKNHRHRICRKLELKDENNALLKWAHQHKK